MKITVDRNLSYAPGEFLVCQVTGDPGQYDWDPRDEATTLLVQTDLDFPGLAANFGFIPCKCGATDGTVDCAHKTASDMITAAARFLHKLIKSNSRRRFIDDPGYFLHNGGDRPVSLGLFRICLPPKP